MLWRTRLVFLPWGFHHQRRRGFAYKVAAEKLSLVPGSWFLYRFLAYGSSVCSWFVTLCWGPLLVTKSCLTLCSLTGCSMPAFPVLHYLPECAQIQLVMPSNHLILCHPFLLPSIFPSIRVFSNESALHIR